MQVVGVGPWVDYGSNVMESRLAMVLFVTCACAIKTHNVWASVVVEVWTVMLMGARCLAATSASSWLRVGSGLFFVNICICTCGPMPPQDLLAKINQSLMPSSSRVLGSDTSGQESAGAAMGSMGATGQDGFSVARHRSGSVSIHVPAPTARAAVSVGSPVGASSTLSPMASGIGNAAGALNGKQFFREARKRLAPAKFDSFLDTIKSLNAHSISREQVRVSHKSIAVAWTCEYRPSKVYML